MRWLYDLVTNPFLLTSLSGWMVAQILKVIINGVVYKTKPYLASKNGSLYVAETCNIKVNSSDGEIIFALCHFLIKNLPLRFSSRCLRVLPRGI